MFAVSTEQKEATVALSKGEGAAAEVQSIRALWAFFRILAFILRDGKPLKDLGR